MHQPQKGPAAARNRGAARAVGDFLCFTDDDCIPDRQWLNALATVFGEFPHYSIGGKTSYWLKINPYAETSQLIIDVVYENSNTRKRQQEFFAANNLAVSTDHFRQIGGFNPDFKTAEDREFCDRWLNHGYLKACLI